jgi:mTERF domain-containing protein
LLLRTSADSLHLRSFAALSTFARRRPLGKLCTQTHSPLLLGQQSTRRGLCTARGALTDEEELQEYLQLTDAEVARIVDKCAGSNDFVGNGVNHNFVEGRLKPLKEYLGLTIAELRKIVHRFPSVLGYNHDNLVNEKLEPLKRHLGLTDAELKKIVVSMPPVLSCTHDNLVNEKLEPLQRHLDLTDAELKKIVVSFPAVFSQNHDSVVEKLKLQQECLGYTDEELRAEVVALPHALSYGNIEEKWALMNSGFAEEEGGQKLAALRRLGPRGLGMGLARLQDRLADLQALLGRAPKASEWFQRLVMYKPSRWEDALANHARE